MNYQQWECKKHGNFQYKEKYLVNCQECFDAMRLELLNKNDFAKAINSERVNALHELEKVKKLLGRKMVAVILKSK